MTKICLLCILCVVGQFLKQQKRSMVPAQTMHMGNYMQVSGNNSRHLRRHGSFWKSSKATVDLLINGERGIHSTLWETSTPDPSGRTIRATKGARKSYNSSSDGPKDQRASRDDSAEEEDLGFHRRPTEDLCSVIFPPPNPLTK